jgi:polyhydroxyalkanoate synthesis regulator phasin
MKLQSTLIITSLALGFLTGCGQKEEPATPPPAQSQGSKLVETVNDAGKQAIDAARAAGQQVGEQAKEVVKDAGQAINDTAKTVTQDLNAAAKSALGGTSSSVTETYNKVVAQAQALLKDAKYEEALNSLKNLGSLALSPEQKKVVTDLQTQIQTAWDASKKAGGAATEAVKGLFK